ncbi:hypothetical protein [Paenibacillus sp. J22TS3]|uniref:hypothetical protein n=1 Tax=Paenibacillus sp. J22TS3 TaxID=2807192 RepID=UPI0027962F8C|nr:hypothetical protein [Paenibacillus sp. J22TS3]
MNIQRVAARVKNGGHHIPSEDIIRRHHTSIENLLAHLDLIDYLVLIDNSESDGKIVMEADQKRIIYRVAVLPEWVRKIEKHLDQI